MHSRQMPPLSSCNLQFRNLLQLCFCHSLYVQDSLPVPSSRKLSLIPHNAFLPFQFLANCSLTHWVPFWQPQVTSRDGWALKHSSPCERQAHSWLRSFNPSFASDKASAAIKVTARPFSHVVWAGWGWPGVSALTNCAGQGGTWDLWTGRLSEPCVYGGNFAPKSPASPIVSVLIHSSFILIAPVWPELGMGGQSSMKGFKVLKDGPAHLYLQFLQKMGSWWPSV